MQGSTIKNVILDSMNICYNNSNRQEPRFDIQMRNRLLYTGLSRTSNIGIILNW